MATCDPPGLVTHYRLPDLRTRRGLAGVEYVVGDEHAGLVQAPDPYFPEAAHQRCRVHYVGNALARQYRRVAHRGERGCTMPGCAHARRGVGRVRAVERLRCAHERSPRRPTGWRRRRRRRCLLPTARRRAPPAARSTNSVGRDHADIHRRTRVVRIFPNDASLVRLASALAIERNGTWMERRSLTLPGAPPSRAEPRKTARAQRGRKRNYTQTCT